MTLGAAMPDGYGGFDKKGGRMRFIGTPTLLKPNYTGPVDRIARAFDRTGKDWNHPAPTTSASR